MAYRERVLEYLLSIAPASAGNRQIARALGIRWEKTVYRATQRLWREGQVRRTLEGQRYLYAVADAEDRADLSLAAGTAPAPPPDHQGQPVEAPPSAASVRSDERRERVGLLKDLLSLAEGRAWLLERLRCPCTDAQARSATVSVRTRPLQRLLEEDYVACAGAVDAQELLAQTYNASLRLADDCGIRKVWRADRPTAMRLPLPPPHAGWTPRLLTKHIASKRYLKRALRALKLVRTRVDAMLLAGPCVVLLQCAQLDSITEARLARLKKLGGVLERRLQRRFFLGGIVDSPEQLAMLDIQHVLWDEVLAWLDRNVPPEPAREVQAGTH